MKILHVDTGKLWRGGQQQVFYLHSGLCRRGIPSTLVCTLGGELHKKAAKAGLPVIPMPLRGEWDLFSARRIAGLLKEEGYTHLHLHSSHAQGIGLAAAFMARFLNVIVTRRVDFVPKNHLMNRWKYGPGVARFVAISTAISNILKGFGVPADRVRLVPSGVDPEKPKPGTGERVRNELGLAPGQPLIGNIAALADHKGQKYLVEAVPLVLAERPDARFAIVGDGELLDELQKRAAELNLGKSLVFTGFRKDVEAVMDALDVFVMPSVMEGLGTAALDALAARKPVVAASSGGLPDIIEDGVNGFLVPPKSPEALAGAILKLLQNSALGAAFAEKGHEVLQKRFSADAMVEGNLAVYRELPG